MYKRQSIYNQVKRGDLEGVKIGAGTHQRLAGVPFRITSKTTGETVSYTHLLGGASEMLICSSRISTVVCAAVRHVRKRGRTGEMTVWDLSLIHICTAGKGGFARRNKVDTRSL